MITRCFHVLMQTVTTTSQRRWTFCVLVEYEFFIPMPNSLVTQQSGVLTASPNLWPLLLAENKHLETSQCLILAQHEIAVPGLAVPVGLHIQWSRWYTSRRQPRNGQKSLRYSCCSLSSQHSFVFSCPGGV